MVHCFSVSSPAAPRARVNPAASGGTYLQPKRVWKARPIWQAMLFNGRAHETVDTNYRGE
ncbi:hypothetical protein OIDMADRAFT_17354 [Oidiodendron maius Zn]|uniref:Uncharacterized protein n=1 Tax=Oidiodendron maius (strain Zn) TaxID=913774 RepID=A0A0C3DWM2_OIDMZ|nr:hypothetical protein OIDMADRAFT_17354 [Oidiodendron maius Zn]